MPSEIETFGMSAMNRYLQEQAKDAISRAQHTIRKEHVNLEPGTWVMYFRRGKVTRGAIGAPSKSGLWLGLARVQKPFNNGVGRCIPRQDKLVLSGYRTETS